LGPEDVRMRDIPICEDSQLEQTALRFQIGCARNMRFPDSAFFGLK
jgi:hypothetical protein